MGSGGRADEQLGLTLTLGLRAPAAARDPDTSHDAAARAVEAGLLGRQMLATLQALDAWVGGAPTSAELAGDDTYRRFAYARRLADLRCQGYVTNGEARACRKTGARAMTWALTPAGAAVLARDSRPKAAQAYREDSPGGAA